MRRLFLILLPGLLALSACKPRSQEPTSQQWLRWHCAGMDAMSVSNATVLPQLAALPATLPLRDALAGQALEALLRELQPTSNSIPPATAAALRPLLDLALRREHVFEIHGDTDGAKTWLLAVRIEKERVEKMGQDMSHLKDEARGFEKAFKDTLAGLHLPEPERFNLRYCGGWYCTLPDKTIVDFLEMGPWVILGTGTHRQPMLDALRRVEKSGLVAPALDGRWARLEVECEKLPVAARLAPLWKSFTIEAAPKGADVTLNGRVTLREPFSNAPPGWTVPTSLIRDPLVAFSATRDAAKWLRPPPPGLSPAPQQFFTWAQAQVPFFTHAAVPMNDTAQSLASWAAFLPGWIEREALGGKRGVFEHDTAMNELRWKGLPLLSPVLAATNDGVRGFLHLSLFPPRPQSPPAPPELFAQLERAGLLSYGWEITGERARQWRHLKQLWSMVRLSAGSPSTLARQDWLEAAAPLLGNTVTEIHRAGDAELSFIRKGPLGLTGFELALLAEWADAFIAEPQPARALPPGMPAPPGL